MTVLSELFTAGAHRYDLLVGANPGYHRHLRAAAARIGRWCTPHRVLDLGCGTGASTRALLRELPGITVLGVDASDGMIEAARARHWPEGWVRFVPGRAEDLDAILAREGDAGDDAPQPATVDAALAAYLLRNVPAADRDGVLTAIAEHLAPGGVLALQDYSVAGDRRARLVWDAVCWLVVIPLSALVLRDTRLYRYLWRSVRDMEGVPQWCTRLDGAGFEVLEVHHGLGWQHGVLHTVIAQRPVAEQTR